LNNFGSNCIIISERIKSIQNQIKKGGACMSVKREDLIKAAKELNDVLGLDPQIKTGKKVTENELSEQILEAAELILPEDDISEETMRVIKLLKEESVEEEDDDEVEEEEVEDEEEDEDEEVDVKETEGQDEEEVNDELEEEKPAEKSKVKAKPTPPSTGVGVTRIGAAALVIKRAKNPMTVEDWVKRTDELYVKEGGKPNLKESRYAVNVAVKVLETYGLIEVKGDKVSKLE
jgi:glutamyl/glutaminyl-tRNA synthetase